MTISPPQLDDCGFLDDLMQDEDLVDLNVNQKLDRILDNQRVLFKLVSDLLRETRAVNNGGGTGGCGQSIDYVERVDFIQSFLGSPSSDGRASSGRDTGDRENTVQARIKRTKTYA